ncbi:MAG TPA: RidA family protein [Mycobacteriales bacterium]|jgi:enamine deaminase RidA (YjgF/YER057c/UK114 family)
MRRISSGGPWEASIGYSRAVVAGPWVLTSGCTSTVDGQVTHVDDAHGQTLEAFGIALRALAEAGAGPEHVVRTRMYVTDIALLDEVGRAHGELFGEVRPAATMVGVAGLAHPDHLVEVEVEAYLP